MRRRLLLLGAALLAACDDGPQPFEPVEPPSSGPEAQPASFPRTTTATGGLAAALVGLDDALGRLVPASAPAPAARELRTALDVVRRRLIEPARMPVYPAIQDARGVLTDYAASGAAAAEADALGLLLDRVEEAHATDTGSTR